MNSALAKACFHLGLVACGTAIPVLIYNLLLHVFFIALVLQPRSLMFGILHLATPSETFIADLIQKSKSAVVERNSS